MEELDQMETYLNYNMAGIQSSSDSAVLSMSTMKSFADANRLKVKKTRECGRQTLENEIQK
jgi:hypothetical protein